MNRVYYIGYGRGRISHDPSIPLTNPNKVPPKEILGHLKKLRKLKVQQEMNRLRLILDRNDPDDLGPYPTLQDFVREINRVNREGKELGMW